MKGITPIKKLSLSDSLAKEIRSYIVRNNFDAGDKLPSTAEMAKVFGVGVPTLREAVKKLETLGFIRVKHGSGIYVGKYFDTLFMPNPVIKETSLKKKRLLEMLEIRILLEKEMFSRAVKKLSNQQLVSMEKSITEAKDYLNDYDEYGHCLLGFTKEIKASANNSILNELVKALASFFTDEESEILEKNLPIKEDFELQCMLLNAYKQRDEEQVLSVLSFRLEKIKDIIIKKFPDDK